ncbi:MAG: dUTP diphosphatase [Candidatus Coatesbacteria bacterium]|nr:dUTP diphosphatase [Candidatus Coatesbacteria bacterium]
MIPRYHSDGAAGIDLHACISEPVVLRKGIVNSIPTGLSVAIDEGYEGQIRARSSLASRGIIIPNSPGTIDSDFRGEIKILLLNLSEEPYEIQPNERIAQLVIAGYRRVEIIETEELPETQRGSGGFGSSGKI